MLLSLGYLTSLFYYIPKAALAAVIIMAVAPLLDTGIARTLWRMRSTWLLVRQCEVVAALLSLTTVPAGAGGSRGSGRCHPGVRGQAPRVPSAPAGVGVSPPPVPPDLTPAGGGLSAPLSPGLDLLPLSVTFLLCFWEVQYGVLAGMLVSLLVLLHSVARPGMQVPPPPPAGPAGFGPRGRTPRRTLALHLGLPVWLWPRALLSDGSAGGGSDRSSAAGGQGR